MWKNRGGLLSALPLFVPNWQLGIVGWSRNELACQCSIIPRTKRCWIIESGSAKSRIGNERREAMVLCFKATRICRMKATNNACCSSYTLEKAADGVVIGWGRMHLSPIHVVVVGKSLGTFVVGISNLLKLPWRRRRTSRRRTLSDLGLIVMLENM